MTIGQTRPSSSSSRFGAVCSPGTLSGGYGAVAAGIDWMVEADKAEECAEVCGVVVPDAEGVDGAVGWGVVREG